MLRNRVFAQITDCNQPFSEKTRFLAPPKISETGFFAVFRLCIDILGKNPVSRPTRYTTIYNTDIRAKILRAQKNPNRSPLNVQKCSSKHY